MFPEPSSNIFLFVPPFSVYTPPAPAFKPTADELSKNIPAFAPGLYPLGAVFRNQNAGFEPVLVSAPTNPLNDAELNEPVALRFPPKNREPPIVLLPRVERLVNVPVPIAKVVIFPLE
jgi:hypothetical protein